MNFEFSADQKMIQEQARSFLTAKSAMPQVRKILDGEDAFDRGLWQAMVELGWQGTTIAEAYGGTGLGYLELCVIAGELGRCLAPVPFSSSVYIATEALKLAGSEQQQQHYLPRLANGELIGTLAAVEQPGRFTAAGVKTTMQDGVLNGEKIAVADGDVADFAVVAAQSTAGLSLYLVDLIAGSVKRQTITTLDPTRSHAQLSFSNTPAELLGEEGGAEALLAKLYDGAAVLYAFEQVGGAQACLDMAKAYTLQRYAFGRPIASFQALKHKMADMFVAIELARSNAYHGAWALSCASAELPVSAATARLSAIDAYYFCSKENMQAHGGMGFTWELDCHLYYRRAQLLALTLGSKSHWQDLLIERLQGAPCARMPGDLD